MFPIPGSVQFGQNFGRKRKPTPTTRTKSRHQPALLTGLDRKPIGIHGAEMSSRRVLVGLAADRALPPAPLPLFRRSYGSGPAPAVMRPLRPGTTPRQPCSACRRTRRPRGTFLPPPPHPPQQQQQQPDPAANLDPLTDRVPPAAPGQPSFHTASPLARVFRVAPPAAPTVRPRSPSSGSSSALPDDGLPLPEQFRSLMRLVTHSVVVCTSAHPGAPPTPRAMTMSSFTSLALAPSPVVSFNIATPSRTLDAVRASRRFNVHVLADDAAGARVADWLARGNAGGRGDVFERLAAEGGCEVVENWGRGGEKGGGSSPQGECKGEGGCEPPVLKGDGVLYVLRCKLLEDGPARGIIPVRDHVIVLGEVLEIVEGSGAARGAKGNRFGLLYADRRYRQLGNCIIPAEGQGSIEGGGEAGR